jgi:type II secretory pathway pseudopilin PulG
MRSGDSANREHGFTYLFVLVAIAILSIGLDQVSEVWTTTARRQQLEQLDWIGEQYVNALGSYYESTPGRAKAFPVTVTELLEDRRFAISRRHLRELYPNPASPVGEWEMIIGADLRVHGVRTRVSWDGTRPIREWTYRPQ